jgi:hypothetical protein
MNIGLVLAMICLVATITSTQILLSQHSAHASVTTETTGSAKAPMANSGENIYTTWWTNKSGNWEVMFRASNDNGATFGDKMNLSNSSDADSWNSEILATGDSVFVSWWESSRQNDTSESVMRISTDNGATFGPLLVLGTNGTIGEAATAEGETEEGE